VTSYLLPMGQRLTVLLPNDVIAEIERIRADLTELIWNGLPTDSKVRIKRERAARKQEDLSDG